ncbi:MAG: xylulokinase [Lachnospiraceae bacterium]|nr:xylulokinase [Lachnospiraceae bacterium]
MKYVMGIDLGTSSTKALIEDESGRPMGSGSGSYGISIPVMSYAEQDPREYWQAVVTAIGGALKEAGISGGEIAGIGFSGQMHGMVALDENKEPVCPAIIHLDQRSGSLLEKMRELGGDVLEREVLNQPCAGMIISTLFWIRENEPALYEKIRYVMSVKDYIRFRLCGELGTECSDAAATLAFSVRNRQWCGEWMDRLGIRRDIWVPVHESYEVAGTITPEAAAETGLSTQTVVVYGAGDSLAALTGNGVVEKGVMACNIGTSSQLAVIADRPIFDPQMRVQTWCHTVPGRWAVQAGTLNGGSTLSWLRNKVLKDTRPFAELDREAGMTPAGAEGLYFIPYLAGERTPYNEPQAKGTYFGLGMKHEQGHIIRATMEGILLNLNECVGILDEMKAERSMLISSGGAARGVTWKQIQADVLDMPVHTTKVKEEACHGACILAAVGLGWYADIREACQDTVQLDEHVTEPIREHVKLYAEKQAVYHDLLMSVRDMYSRIV